MSNPIETPEALMARYRKKNFNAGLGMRPRHWTHLAMSCKHYGRGHDYMDAIPSEWREMVITHIYATEKPVVNDKRGGWIGESLGKRIGRGGFANEC